MQSAIPVATAAKIAALQAQLHSRRHRQRRTLPSPCGL